jgi:transposase
MHEYRVWVGIDWATEAHQVCVLDGDRRVLGERSVPHSGTGLGELADWLNELASQEPGCVAVAIEVPRGAVVETLVERGIHVYAINPKQLDRFRDRHTAAGAKDDRRDALVLANSLRTDLPSFRRVELQDPLIIQLREMSRVDDELKEEVSRLTNRLREQVHRYYVQLLELCPAADEPWLWSLLERAPSPVEGKKLPRGQVERLLKSHRIRRLSADDVIERLRTPPLHVAPGVVEAARAHIALLLPRLRLVTQQRRQCESQIEALLESLCSEATDLGPQREHRDAKILRSLPGVGSLVAAAMLGEASQPLADRDYQVLRAQVGSAPVTIQSGKHRRVVMRRACNARLRCAVYHWARVNLQHDARSRAAYTSMRARGHSHGRALRGIADKLLYLLIAMLKKGELYDPARRQVAEPAARAA